MRRIKNHNDRNDKLELMPNPYRNLYAFYVSIIASVPPKAVNYNTTVCFTTHHQLIYYNSTLPPLSRYAPPHMMHYQPPSLLVKRVHNIIRAPRALSCEIFHSRFYHFLSAIVHPFCIKQTRELCYNIILLSLLLLK